METRIWNDRGDLYIFPPYSRADPNNQIKRSRATKYSWLFLLESMYKGLNTNRRGYKEKEKFYKNRTFF